MKPFLKSSITTLKSYFYETSILTILLINILVVTYGTVYLNTGIENIQSCPIGQQKINITDKNCTSNQCFCENGIAAKGVLCGRNYSLTCDPNGCDAGFHVYRVGGKKERSEERKNQKMKIQEREIQEREIQKTLQNTTKIPENLIINTICKQNLCTCSNGTPKNGKNCTENGKENCDSCFPGFEKYGFDEISCLESTLCECEFGKPTKLHGICNSKNEYREVV